MQTFYVVLKWRYLPIHFDQYRKEILFNYECNFSFFFLVKRSVAASNGENFCESKGYDGTELMSERNTRAREIHQQARL